MVRRVAGRGEALEPDDLVADDVDVLRRDGGELAPECVERVAVESARARLELRRIYDVRSPDLGDVHLQAGVLADERACGAGVVEVDVREEQVPQIGQLETARCEPGLQMLDAGRGATVEERGPVVGLEQVAADDRPALEVEEVDRLRPSSGRARRSRSAMRSSADSIPTESRMSVGGTANGASAVDACVIRAGCSIRLSTPPRLSASFQIFVRATRSTASCSSSRRNDTIPPKSRIWRAAISCPGCAGRPG